MKDKQKIGIIVIHGFGGNTAEIEPLATELSFAGYQVVTPELKGHSGVKGAFRKVTYRDWIKDVESAYLDMSKYCDNVVLIGFSMGGLLSLNIASRYKVRGVITLNTPYVLNNAGSLKTMIDDVFKSNYGHLKKYLKTMFRLPLSAYVNFMKLLKATKCILKTVKCDIYVNQAYHDDVVSYKSAQFIHDNVASINKKMMYYDDSDHLILHSKASKTVIKDVMAYLDTLTKKAQVTA